VKRSDVSAVLTIDPPWIALAWLPHATATT
jgi:hypothetical protein